MKHIALTGYMGSGKTRLGKKLAKDLGWDFVDLDQYIETERGLTVAEIFAAEGEAFFRTLENKYLQDILIETKHKVVLSLGGGALQNDANLKILLQYSFLVYLKFNVKVLRDRLENSKNQRPIIAGLKGEALEKFITDHLKTREEKYERAHFKVDNVMDINTRTELIIEAYGHFK